MVRIREFTADDREAVITCIIEVQEYERALETDRSKGKDIAEDFLNLLINDTKIKRGKIFVAEIDNEIAGFISVCLETKPEELLLKQKEWAYISDLIVLPEFRRKGIGKELIKKAEKHVLTHSVPVIKLIVLDKNKLARNFYEKLGYRDYEITMVKYLNSGE